MSWYPVGTCFFSVWASFCIAAGEAVADRNGESSQELKNSVLQYLKDGNLKVTICLEKDVNCLEKCERGTEAHIGALTQQREGFNLNISSDCLWVMHNLTQSRASADGLGTNTSAATSRPKPTQLQVWGFGFLFVTLINLCSVAGIVMVPCMEFRFCGDVLMYMVALSAGTLTSMGVLVLIPEGFHIIAMDGYLWRACCILGGVYLFFVGERVLKILTDRYSTTASSKPKDAHKTSNRLEHVVGLNNNDQSPKLLEMDSELSPITKFLPPLTNGTEEEDEVSISPSVRALERGHSHKLVSTSAWMIMVGDAVHKLMDGLSIGAAFTESTLLGISIAVAILCEELPHELGDIAILLKAGMSKRRAFLVNFLAGCPSYVGLVIGITLSEAMEATSWILATAGGVFIYISLADILPEMTHEANEKKNQPLKVLLLQNLGFLTGFAAIFSVSYFGGNLDL